MNFDRITENQSYERIVRATEHLRRSGTGYPFIEEHPEFIKFKFNFEKCTTSGFGISGEGEYDGFIVTGEGNNYEVYSIFVDTLCPEDTSIEIWEIKDTKLDPKHSQCDIRKKVPMAIIYYLEQFGDLPDKYKQWSGHG